jgi:hypothetical protein
MRERSGAEPRGSNAREAQGPERSRGTTGQGSDRSQERSRATSREQRERGRSAGSTTGQSERREGTTGQSDRRFEGSTDRRERSTTTGRSERTNVEINEQQRSRIREVLVSRRDIPRVSNINVDVRVGTVVPRSVRFVSVPEEIVRIYPRFRRDRVVIIRDEIVIIDPVTYRIIAVFPA